MWIKLFFYFYADNLKVSTIVSINFFLEKWFNFRVKIGFEFVLDLLPLLMWCVWLSLHMTWSYVRIAMIV